jgi:mono/diheme cytochrome c family protein
MERTAFRIGLALTALLLLTVLAACGGGGSATSAPAGDATHGQQIFAGTCSACHGPDAKGLAGLGKDLTTSTFVKGLSDADLIAFVKRGRPTSDPLNTTGVEMPPKGGNPALTDQDIADVVAFVRTINK